MDAISVKATMTKAEDPCVPQGQQSVVSFAAQFFCTRLWSKNEPE